mmetsp:Transcript_115131/g.179826  ORF Transcript_115131/g.179826 Transcript_115131/m.179826 type:complete len:96 (+) Transcript_115131:260-547(+)
MWGLPLFEFADPAAIIYEINKCRAAHEREYIKLVAFDNRRGVESCVNSFLIQRPLYEPGLRMVRQEAAGRRLNYTIEAYSVVGAEKHRRYPAPEQ